MGLGRSFVFMIARRYKWVWVSLTSGAVFACTGEDTPIGGTPAAPSNGTEETRTETSGELSVSSAPTSSESAVDGDATSAELPGATFSVELTARGERFIDLTSLSIVNSTDDGWDLRFEGLSVFTNGGAAGSGEGASFGPSSDLDLLFDTLPNVPLRADASENALTSWFWFGNDGVTSRFHIYGVRAKDRLFKVQLLSYRGQAHGGHVGNGEEGGEASAAYRIRYGEVNEGGGSAVRELTVDASAGGTSAPAGATTGCVELTSGAVVQLTSKQRAVNLDWDICFQRTEIILNGGSSGKGDVSAVDLDWDPATGADQGLTDEEVQRTAESERERFEAFGHADLTAEWLPWDKQYPVLPRIGERWLTSDSRPVPGTWFVRDASGGQHFAVLFTGFTPIRSGAALVEMQVKPLIAP